MLEKNLFAFSLIERVILSAGAMLIFSVLFQFDQMPEGRGPKHGRVEVCVCVCRWRFKHATCGLLIMRKHAH